MTAMPPNRVNVSITKVEMMYRATFEKATRLFLTRKITMTAAIILVKPRNQRLLQGKTGPGVVPKRDR